MTIWDLFRAKEQYSMRDDGWRRDPVVGRMLTVCLAALLAVFAFSTAVR